MTEAEAKWLTTLRDHGPQSIGLLFRDHPQAIGCLSAGWTEWTGDPNRPEEITPKGIAALVAHSDANGVE
jgi:hypothetical protein